MTKLIAVRIIMAYVMVGLFIAYMCMELIGDGDMGGVTFMLIVFFWPLALFAFAFIGLLCLPLFIADKLVTKIRQIKKKGVKE